MEPRAHLLGCEIDRLGLEETVRRCIQLVEHGTGPSQHVVLNAAKVVALRRDPRLRSAVEGCALVNADGMSVVWASRLLGDPLPERVAGIDLMERLLAVAEQRGWRVFVLGARADVLGTALARLRERHPRLSIAGRHGWFTDAESAAVCDEIRSAQPQLLLVAMSSPRKELWLAEHLPSLGVPLAMGVGGAIDVVAGVTSRAPVWLQRAGLEWVFRLLQEPRRLARRYAVTNCEFSLLLLRELLRTRLLGKAGS